MVTQHRKAYRLLRELPLYPVGTVIIHEYTESPSIYKANSTYVSEGDWFIEENIGKVRAKDFLVDLIKWCTASQRTDDNHEGWIEKL